MRARTAFVAALVAYAIAFAATGAVRTPLSPGEAKAIFAGREALAVGAPHGPLRPSEAAVVPAAQEWPGAAALIPLGAALAERRAGLPGARFVGAAMGIALLLLLYRFGEETGGRGPLVAATFVLLGAPLELFATVHPRAGAALLIGLAMRCGEPRALGEAERSQSSLGPIIAGASLAFAAAVCPTATYFAVPLAASLALRSPDRRGAAALALTFAAGLALSLWAGPSPFPREAFWILPPGGGSALNARLIHTLDGLAMPLLLASFALFHRDGARAAASMALACAAFLVPLVSQSMDEAHTARLLATVLLAPAAGLGVERMARLFASGNPFPIARPFFVGAVLTVVWVFGIHETRTLRDEGSELTDAATFLRAEGAAGRTVLVESDHGSPEDVYRYLLEGSTPPVRVVPLVRADEAERGEALRRVRPAFVVIDQRYAERSFGAALRQCLGDGFTVAATYRMGPRPAAPTVQILRGEGL